MLELRKARGLHVVFTVTGAIGAVVVIAYVHHSKSVSTLQSPSPVVQTEDQSTDQSVDQADRKKSSLSEPLSLGRLFGCNNPAPPPIVMPVGRPHGQADTPDLSTPAQAVQTVLSLIDQAATDKLALCFINETKDAVSNLYPRYLGHPIGLVEVIEEGESAEVIWDATVHTEFSHQGRHWSPGEVMTLAARLVRVEASWRLLQLHDGDKDGNRQDNASTN